MRRLYAAAQRDQRRPFDLDLRPGERPAAHAVIGDTDHGPDPARLLCLQAAWPPHEREGAPQNDNAGESVSVHRGILP